MPVGASKRSQRDDVRFCRPLDRRCVRCAKTSAEFDFAFQPFGTIEGEQIESLPDLGF